jgi:iron complex outermembrane receptor protein
VIDDYLAFPGAVAMAHPPPCRQRRLRCYDYRVPDDERRNDEAQAVMIGKFATAGCNTS